MLLLTHTAHGQSLLKRFREEISNENKVDTILGLPYADTRFLQFSKNTMDSKAPNFTFESINGDSISLNQFIGKVVFLNIFFRACGPCIVEVPSLNQLANEYKSKDVVFIAISLTDSKKSVLHFIERYNADATSITFIPASLQGELDDGYDKNNTSNLYRNITKQFLQEKYFVPVAPANIIIDKQGIIKLSILGYAKKSQETYNQLFREALDESLREP